MRYLGSGFERFRALVADARGAAVIEFALVSTVLIGMLLPLIDVGMAFYYKSNIITAAEAGAQYAFNKSAYDSANMQIAARSATAISGNSTYADSFSANNGNGASGCGCTNGTTITYYTGAACPALCPGGQTPGKYATSNASVTYKPLINYGGFGTAITLNASSTVRYQ